ncbi:MAG: LpqB family beta-propeller domain-containing protein [Pyrinomonadaceae bacterium]
MKQLHTARRLSAVAMIFLFCSFCMMSAAALPSSTVPASTLFIQSQTLAAGSTRIAFATDRDGSFQIYTMNSDGSNQINVSNSAADDISPAWSPDGSKLAFVSDRDGNNEIYTMNADGSNQQRLTDNAANDLSPAWSPDNTRIAFVSARNGNDEIYVMKADGTGQIDLSNNLADDFGVAWSPDGARLAFASNRDGVYQIYSMYADGSGQFNLSRSAGDDVAPNWTQSSITFQSNRDGNDEIYTMNANGSGQSRLTNDAAFDLSPARTSDNSSIVFVSTRGGSLKLYALNASNGNVSQLTSTNADTTDFQPAVQSQTSTPQTNPIDDTNFFVRQQYLDFLNREPDAGGFAYWTGQINQCRDAACVSAKRTDVSAAFFIEQEFQQTGYYVYRVFKASNDGRQISFAPYLSARNSVIGGSNLASAQANYAAQQVNPAYASLSNDAYVDRLYTNAGVATANRTERAALISGLNSGSETRATVLQKIANNSTFVGQDYNPAFVLAEYFSYLRRDPDAAGYQFWLDVLNNKVPNNYRSMVCAFINSAEYQLRFGSAQTRTDADCAAR